MMAGKKIGTLMFQHVVGRPMEILLVEGNVQDARATMELLKQGNVRCRVTLMRDGEEALVFLRREGIFARAPRPDLILLDLDSPKKDGRQVLAEMRADEELRMIPVVVLAVAGSDPSPLAADDYDLHQCMTKPLPEQRLINLIKSLHYTLLTEIVLSASSVV